MSTAAIIRAVFMLLLMLGVLGWWILRSLRRSEEPVGLVVKCVITLLMLPAIFMAGSAGPFGIPFAAVLGIILAITWGRSIGAAVAQPFMDLFTGGDTPPDPQPYYSIAQANRKKGKFHEAVFAIHHQLQKFPNDATGQMMLAEVQAENLNDLPGAQVTIERLCAQPGHGPGTIGLALNSLADWHLKFGQDIDSARQALERIIERLPGSEPAQMAAQRIAHLGTTENLLASRDAATIRLTPGVNNIGLLKESASLGKRAADPGAEAAEYVKHLEQHPLDSEVREKLALIYAEHYQRLDLATDQLEQLIEQPNQPAKLQAHWLNLLASLHVEHGNDYELARSALQRIVEAHPGTAIAALAEQRLAHLKLDLKGKEKSQPVKLGTYAQNIGLNKPR